MANHKGSEGTVRVGTNPISELRGWELTTTGETIEDTTLNDTAKTFQAGNTGWTGSASTFWDETDTNAQQTMDAGASIALQLYPEGTAASSTYFSGTAIITSVARRAGINTMVEAEFSFQGNGALTETTVGA